MTKKFTGTFTALVTPMVQNTPPVRFADSPPASGVAQASVDFRGVRKLIRDQVRAGVNGIVIMGTTAETPTLTRAEEKKLISIARAEIAGHGESSGRAALIIGTGTNNTLTTIENTRRAMDAGADAALVVTPYYNKPNTNGLIEHFRAVAAVGLPIIVYNIFGRTGRNITVEEMKTLAEIPNIVGVKEASGDMTQIRRVIDEIKKPMAARGRDFFVLSGDDGLTLDVMRAGGDGVVSVISNLVPARVREMTDAANAGDFARAAEIDASLAELSKMAFIDGNPVSIKYIMAAAGAIKSGVCRLPLGAIASDKGSALDEFVKQLIIKN